MYPFILIDPKLWMMAFWKSRLAMDRPSNWLLLRISALKTQPTIIDALTPTMIGSEACSKASGAISFADSRKPPV